MIRAPLFFLCCVCFLLAMPIHAKHAKAEAAEQPVRILIDGVEVKSDDPAYIVHGKMVVPVRFVSEKFGAKLDWNNKTNQATVDTPLGDHLVFTLGQYKVAVNGKTYISDTSPMEKNGRTYLPLRSIAEFMHAAVQWSDADKTASFTSKPLYTVEEGDTVASVAKQFGLQEEWMKEYNKLDGNDLSAGSQLKVVIPSVITDQAKNQDMYLLAKLIDAEAGDEPLKGKIAVGDVVMNRVDSDLFPDSIHDVIYAPGQFTPALNGDLDKIEPREDSILAASLSINGENVVEGALYFFNPKRSANAFLDALDVVADIGGHRFAK